MFDAAAPLWVCGKSSIGHWLRQDYVKKLKLRHAWTFRLSPCRGFRLAREKSRDFIEPAEVRAVLLSHRDGPLSQHQVGGQGLGQVGGLECREMLLHSEYVAAFERTRKGPGRILGCQVRHGALNQGQENTPRARRSQAASAEH